MARVYSEKASTQAVAQHPVEFEEIDVTEYEKQCEEQQIKYVKKKAAKLGFQLVPA